MVGSVKETKEKRGESGAEKRCLMLSKIAWRSLRQASGTDREFLECLLLQLRLCDPRFLSVASGDGGASRVRSFLTPAEALVDFNQGTAIHVYELGLDLNLDCAERTGGKSRFRDLPEVATAWDPTTCAEDAAEGYPAQIDRRERIIAGVVRENEELKRRALEETDRLMELEKKLSKAEHQWRAEENSRITAVGRVCQLEEEIETLKLSYSGELERLRAFSWKVAHAGWMIRLCFLLAPSLTLRRWQRKKGGPSANRTR